VPPIRIDGGHFSPDTLTLIELFAAKQVRYLVVGGEAVILHGHVRLTGDVDLFFSNDAANRDRLFSALESFWEGDIPGVESPGAFAPDGMIVQFGRPPNRIDLINAIDGVAFEEAWLGRVDAVVVRDEGEVPVPFIGLDDLVKNKRASGRPKDLDDLSYLTSQR
jgi:Nucleotidyltransferase of unknown function (DUF6036)